MPLWVALVALYVAFVLVPLVVLALFGLAGGGPGGRAALVVVIGSGAWLAISAFAFRAFIRRLRRGLREIRETADAYARGDLSQRARLYGQDGLSRAGRAMNDMAAALERRMEEAAAGARFDLRRRCRSELAGEVEGVSLDARTIAALLNRPDPPPSIARGAGRAVARLATRLRRVARVLAGPELPAGGAAANGVANGAANGVPNDPARAHRAAAAEGPPALSRLVEHVLEASGVRDAPAIRVRASVSPDLPPVGVPTAQLEHALLDLIRNAQRAMPEGGLLKIDARAEGGRVGLAVIDSGMGIPRRYLERQLFRPFASGWANGRGFGLSLYRTRAHLVRHGGDVEVSSREGVGTRVTMWLPVVTTAVPLTAVRPASGRS